MRRLLIISTATAVLLSTAAPAALAAEGAVVHRESVLTELDATGAPGTSRVFTQLTVPAGQEVRLSGQSTASLRTLSGIAAQRGDDVVFGAGLSRTVADHTAELPVAVAVSYSIDGETVDAEDVVGHDGEVAVTYTVTNLTAEARELTVIDGDRVGSKQTVDVAVPMVASLSMTLPSMFDEVSAPGAVVVGDGRGNTVVNWSLLLFSPIGSETQQVTWTADARDAIVPEAVLQVLPVSPTSFGSFESTSDAYRGAVGSTRELTAGARQIDRNLKLLAEGAGKLLAGLTQLRDGSAELAAGLGDARDGAAKLSDGLGAARAGGGELSSGLGDLSDGANQVADGLAQLDAGSVRLVAGLGQLAGGSRELADGVGQLSDGAALLDDNAKQLAAGAEKLAVGAGDLEGGLQTLSTRLLGSDDPATTGAVEQLQAGAVKAKAAIDPTTNLGDRTLRNGVTKLRLGLDNPCDLANPVTTRCGVTQFNAPLGQAAVGVSGGVSSAVDQLEGITSSGALSPEDQARLATALGTLSAIESPAASMPALSGGITAVVTALKAGLTEVDQGLALLSLGLSNANCDFSAPTAATNPCGVLEGLKILEGQLAAGLGSAETPDTLLWGAAQVAGGSALVADGAGRLQSEGTAALAAGAQRAAAGAEQLAAGAAQADAGGTELSAGAGKLADGSVQLADGAQRAAAGSGDLVDGLVQLDDGGQQLADGLVKAADGSDLLADGLQRAVPGGEQIAGGAQRLTDEGTSVLARSVSDASASASLSLAHLTAVAARGTDGDGLPYPTVEGADASAVYEFQLAGVGADAGPAAATQVGMGGLALLAAALLGSLAGGRTRRRDDDEVIELPELVTV